MEARILSDRLQGLLDGFHAARPEVFAQRAVLVTQAYAETEGQPILLQRARMMEKILSGVQIFIRGG